MAMRNKDFVALILTHGRPDKVKTLETLKKCGYTGRVVLVLDDEDKTLPEYRARFEPEGIELFVFSKEQAAEFTDTGDNFPDRRGVVFARNAAFEIAEALGHQYFIVLDDDYHRFMHKKTQRDTYVDKTILDLDAVWDGMLDWFIACPQITSLAMAQTGDFVGGEPNKDWRRGFKRKAMNSFICATDRPFQFYGRVNEDATAYCIGGHRGQLFITIYTVALAQQITQRSSGGLTELYLESGTYVKSFYSVMYHPSGVKVAPINTGTRIHHRVHWNATIPQIVPESMKKARDETMTPSHLVLRTA